MVETQSFVLSPPQKRLAWQRVVIAVAALSMGACGVVDYSVRDQRFASPASRKNPELGVITFHYADDADPYSVHVRRVGGGYALQAPIYEAANSSHIHFTASQTKERSSFIGIEGRFAF